MVLYEKYLQRENSDPRKIMLEKKVPARLKTRIGWRNKTEPLMKQFSHLKRPITPGPSPPWKTTKLLFEQVALEKKKNEYSGEELRDLAMDKIQSIEAEYRLYTDGSTDGNQEKGGAGLSIMNGADEIIEEACFPAGALCSSFAAECMAMSKALDWIQQHPTTCVIISDSMSMLQALKSNDWKNCDHLVREIKDKLDKIDSKTTLLWVPSHCDIPGNERADHLANQGTKMDQKEIEISEKIVKARIRRRKWEVHHDRAKSIYQDRRKPKYEMEKNWPRKIRTLYNRLRTGHAKELAYYRYLIEKEDHPECQCGEEKETTEHILCRCKLLNDERMKHDLSNTTPDRLVTDPDRCRKFLSIRIPELALEKDNEETHVENRSMGCESTRMASDSPVREA